MQNISGLAARNPQDPLQAERTEPAKHKSKQTNGSANLLCNPRLYSLFCYFSNNSQPVSVQLALHEKSVSCLPAISLQSFSHLQFVLFLLPGRSRQFNYSAVDPKRRTRIPHSRSLFSGPRMFCGCWIPNEGLNFPILLATSPSLCLSIPLLLPFLLLLLAAVFIISLAKKP